MDIPSFFALLSKTEIHRNKEGNILISSGELDLGNSWLSPCSLSVHGNAPECIDLHPFHDLPEEKV